MPNRDWDDTFANMAHVEGSEKLPALWAERAAAYRASAVRVYEDIRYGAADRALMDIVWPDGTPKGLAVFVHGGFWIRMDKSHWTDLAEGARANGWAVAIPQYTLAPTARISEMTLQVAAAIVLASEKVEGPIRLAGHSAGGHLVSRMVCADSPLPAPVLDRIAHVLSLSGLHDLRPLMWTAMNDLLKLDEAEADAESVALLRPHRRANLTAWVGGGERPEFIRQTRLLAMMWDGLDVPIREVIEADHNHFSVLEALKDAESPLTRAFIGDTGQSE
ncbi:MAG: alpha/beta hydrolase [Silicimonas sp.]|nr:alpha/beta hydrolase [Silicimonas sp.]